MYRHLFALSMLVLTALLLFIDFVFRVIAVANQDAIIGVTFFSDLNGADGQFDTFAHAFIAMFRIMTGRC